jgi:hypothetical protein
VSHSLTRLFVYGFNREQLFLPIKKVNIIPDGKSQVNGEA